MLVLADDKLMAEKLVSPLLDNSDHNHQFTFIYRFESRNRWQGLAEEGKGSIIL